MNAHVDVKKIRQDIGMTQSAFCANYGFELSTLRNWEQGHRMPSGPSRTLLILISRAPEMVRAALEAARATPVRL